MSDRVVAEVGDVEVARAVECETDGVREPRGCARAVGAARVPGQSGERGHRAGGRGDEADGGVARVGDVEVAGAVRRYAARMVEARRRPCALRRAAHAGRSGERGGGA